MGLRPHDLLRISTRARLSPSLDALPEWAQISLRTAPYVVVRRAIAPEGFIAVGIRGIERGQRVGALLPACEVSECITPESLALCRHCFEQAGAAALPHFIALRQLADAARLEDLAWGPIGSAGFELATGISTLTPQSDLDIVVRFSSSTTLISLRRFRGSLLNTPIRVDVVLEDCGRAVALDEYLASPNRVLIKTPNGPSLGAFPA